MKIAYSPRNIAQIRFKKTIDFSFRAARFFSRKLWGERTTRSVLLYPEVKSAEILGDLINRLSWYLPDERVRIKIHYTGEKRENYPIPASQHPYARERAREFEYLRWLDVSPEDTLLVWKWSSTPLSPEGFARTFIVDPNYYASVEAANWANLLFHTQTRFEKDRHRNESKKIYAKLLDEQKNSEYAYVFTTGPSLERAHEFSYPEKSFKIICNSMVKNQSLLEKIEPDLLVFGDPVFHFSNCQYDHEFRKNAAEVISKYKCYVMIPEPQRPLFLAHYPEFRNYTIGMPVHSRGRVNFPTPENFYTVNTSNIMTLFMVPVAISTSKKVRIIGADGREKKEKYFWKHSKSNQYEELMDSIEKNHPSFFRDRVYTDYYDHHCNVTSEQITRGEEEGVEIQALTPSLIPALKDRFIN